MNKNPLFWALAIWFTGFVITVVALVWEFAGIPTDAASWIACAFAHLTLLGGWLGGLYFLNGEVN